jgi:hypothetical protein
MRDNNPESLKYTIGQKVTWQEQDGSVQQGIVINVGYKQLDVIRDAEEVQVAFDMVLSAS